MLVLMTVRSLLHMMEINPYLRRMTIVFVDQTWECSLLDCGYEHWSRWRFCARPFHGR